MDSSLDPFAGSLLDTANRRDAQRFELFATGMLEGMHNTGLHPEVAGKLQQVLNLHAPRTVDELRTCIDATAVLLGRPIG